MSLFGNYGQKNGSNGGPLFPTTAKASPPVVQTPTPEPSTISQKKPPASIVDFEATPEGGACEKFCLDMSATQFGMCKCGFDRNAHERRKGVLQDKTNVAAAPAVPKIVPGGGPMPVTTKASSPVMKGKGKSKGKGAITTGSRDESPGSCDESPDPSPMKGKAKGKGKIAIGTLPSSERPLEANPEPAARQKSSDAISKLQAVIQGSGFSPLSSDAGKEAGKHVCELPDFLQSALLTIMNATSGTTEDKKRVSFESAESTDRSLQERISRDDDKVQVAASNDGPTPSVFKSSAPALFKAPVVVQPEINGPRTSPTMVVPVKTAQDDTETECAPCGKFQLDLASSQFGMCRCGFDRAAHSSLGKVNQTTIARGRDTKTTSAASRVSSAPPPPSIDDAPSARKSLPGKNVTNASSLPSKAPQFGGRAMVRSASARFERSQEASVCPITSNQSGPCGAFKLDLSSSQFAMCQCGYERSAHVQARKVEESDSRDSKSSTRVYTLDQLCKRKSNGDFDGIDAGKLEDYLEEREFLKAFGMFVADFYKLPAWKQKQAKQKAGIF